MIDCSNLVHLNLASNALGGNEVQLFECLSQSAAKNTLEYLSLAQNELRNVPIQIESLRNLKVLDIQNNKIRSLLCQTTNECPLKSLTNLKELYVTLNRLKDLPTVFHHLNMLRIIGCDWFPYISEPYTL